MMDPARYEICVPPTLSDLARHSYIHTYGKQLLKTFRSFPYKPLAGTAPPSGPTPPSPPPAQPAAAPPSSSSLSAPAPAPAPATGGAAGASKVARAGAGAGAGGAKPAVQYTEEGKQGALGCVKCLIGLSVVGAPHHPSYLPMYLLNPNSADRERGRHGPVLLDADAPGDHGALLLCFLLFARVKPETLNPTSISINAPNQPPQAPSLTCIKLQRIYIYTYTHTNPGVHRRPHRHQGQRRPVRVGRGPAAPQRGGEVGEF